MNDMPKSDLDVDVEWNQFIHHVFWKLDTLNANEVIVSTCNILKSNVT